MTNSEQLYKNTTHKVNLTGGEISTILNYLKEICEGPKVDRIYAELQSVTDNYYAQLEAQDVTNSVADKEDFWYNSEDIYDD